MKRFKLSAQFLYVIAIAWLVAAVGCFISNTGEIALIFCAMGMFHLIVAVIMDIRESRKK